MDDTTPPDVRAMVDKTVALLKAQVGPLRRAPRGAMNETLAQRLEMIRRQAESMQQHPGGQ